MIRPERFIERDLSKLYDGVWLRRGKTFEVATVTALTPLGERPVYATQTSTRTLVTNGYFTHNSFWYYTRDASARYIRNTTMRFAEVQLDTIPIYIQGVSVPYVRANLVKL